MNFKLNLLVVFLIFTGLQACHKNKLVGLDKKIPLMELRKSACFGPCPHYELKIYNDRTVEFHGKNNTAAEGFHTFIMDKNEFKTLVRKFERANLNKYEDNYADPMIPDLQVIKISYSNKDFSKIIAKNDGEPDPLKELETEMENIAVQQGWLIRS